MAGAGWKLWVPGERVDADDLQTYIQDQTEGVFASTAARDLAITAPSEGMTCFITGTDQVFKYSGAAWVEYGRLSGTTSWTPQLDQGASTNSTKTIIEARYVRIGNLIYAWCQLAATAGGTAGSPVTVTLPVAPSGHAANSSLGAGQISDAGTLANSSVVDVWFLSGSMVNFQASVISGAGRWGQHPSIALASGDAVRFHVMYLVA